MPIKSSKTVTISCSGIVCISLPAKIKDAEVQMPTLGWSPSYVAAPIDGVSHHLSSLFCVGWTFAATLAAIVCLFIHKGSQEH